jgi:allantoate deiminase/N-carbamoyl-L-amino-acid hydrolase
MTTTEGLDEIESLVDVERIQRHIDAFAALTETDVEGDGVTRLAYTPLERRAHALFRDHMAGLGLQVRTDAAGNTMAESDGTSAASAHGTTSVAALGTGSHLDSVPSGGRFDGIAGVVASMEIAEIVSTTGLRHRRPWRFVAFAAEEGARFGQACNGSRMVAGLTSAIDAEQLFDASGISMGDAMRSVGLHPERIGADRWAPEDWSAFIELHIEQGVVLEDRQVNVGVVDAISGSTRLAIRVDGRASHTGGTPMHLRRDALVTASRCVLACDELARDPAHHGTRVTVGRLTVHPGSITTIPGRVDFTVDVRDIDSDRQRRTAEALIARFRSIADTARTEVSFELMGDTSPVVLPHWLVAEIGVAAADLGEMHQVLPSGASHDSQQIAHLLATGMIFVPSRDGLSHVPEEHTTAEQLAGGTRTLLRALRRLDGRP